MTMFICKLSPPKFRKCVKLWVYLEVCDGVAAMLEHLIIILQIMRSVTVWWWLIGSVKLASHVN